MYKIKRRNNMARKGKTKAEAERKKRKYIEDLVKGLNPNFKNTTSQNGLFTWLR